MRRGKKVQQICKNCSENFEALAIKVRAGGAKFCSDKCYKEFRLKNKKDEKYLNKINQKKHKYGLNESEYLKLFTVQNNKCGICNKSFKKIRACVDHNHDTKKVRGLLCDKCNRGLGFFDDNIENMKNAIEYLKKNL
jgi:hypothetical protein